MFRKGGEAGRQREALDACRFNAAKAVATRGAAHTLDAHVPAA
jgi:hypothetical protein